MTVSVHKKFRIGIQPDNQLQASLLAAAARLNNNARCSGWVNASPNGSIAKPGYRSLANVTDSSALPLGIGNLTITVLWLPDNTFIAKEKGLTKSSVSNTKMNFAFTSALQW